MKKLWEKVEPVLTYTVGVLCTISLVALSFGVAVWAVKWVLKLLGVL